MLMRLFRIQHMDSKYLFEYVVDKNPNVLFVIDRGVATSGEGVC